VENNIPQVRKSKDSAMPFFLLGVDRRTGKIVVAPVHMTEAGLRAAVKREYAKSEDEIDELISSAKP
jgi:hypothetical protein